MLALIGALGANPDATRRFFRDLLKLIWGAIRWVAGRIRRAAIPFWRWIRREPKKHQQMQGTVHGKVTVSGIGDARMFPEWKRYHSLRRRIGMLDIRTRDLDRRLGNLSQELREVQQQLREELAEKHNRLSSELRELDARVAHLQESSVAADARALPVIAVGVIMTGLSPDIPGRPLWLVLILAVFALIALVWIWRRGLPVASRPS